MTAERTLALVMLALSGVLFSRLAGPAWRVGRIYAGVRRRRQRDAGRTAPIPTPAVASRIETLTGLGFSRVGETYVDLPDVGRRFAWQLVHETGDVYATVVPVGAQGALTGIYSAWADGTWLSTMHPIGERIDDGHLIVQSVPGSLDAALDAHRARLSTIASSHGSPRRVGNLADILDCDVDYRRRYGGRTLVRRTGRIVLPALLGGALLVSSLLLLAVTAR